MRKPLLAPLYFALLQGADLATTLLVIRLGGAEQNMIVARLMESHPVLGLILAKLAVLGIALAIVAARKHRVLRWANLFYSGVVIWNITIIARLAARG